MASASLPPPSTQPCAFLSWDAALGRRICPLVTFGGRDPVTLTSRLVCVTPPLADREELSNASDVRGAVALVVRDGCSFAQKARRIQAAGAIAMIIANNVREEPFAAFTMRESEDEATLGNQDVPITIPCVMMCLYDVRELFKQYPPSVQTGIMTLEVMDTAKSDVDQIIQECKRQRRHAIQQHDSAGDSSSDVGVASANPLRNSVRVGSDIPADSAPLTAAHPSKEESKTIVKSPLFAFVQWSSDASFYQCHYAPLPDFCLAGNNTIYEGTLVACDPILADEPQLRNAHDLSNATALVKRGACTFSAKLERIQRCGAVAAVVGNDDVKNPDAAFVTSVDKTKVDHVTIPSVTVSVNVFDQLVVEKASYVRILCFSGDSAAASMLNTGISISLAEVPMPSGAGGSEEDDVLRQFHEACRQGDHGGRQRILDENCSDDLEKRELVKRLDAAVSLLIRLGASVDTMDTAMQTPLHAACLHGHSSCVRRLVQAGAVQPAVGDIGSMTMKQNIGGSTPLHYAAAAGSTDCLEILLTANARVDGDGKYLFEGVSVVDNDGATPLHIACRSAHTDCSMYLIAASADLDAVDKSGYTPLRICCEMVDDPEFETASLHQHDEQGALDSNSLFLDHIESKTLKRELEVMYLRHEAQLSQRRYDSAQQENSILKAQISQLQIEMKQLTQQNALALKTDAVRINSIQTQQAQIEQLHVHMKTILQLLQSQNEGGILPSETAVVPFHVAHANPLPGTGTILTASTAYRPEEETLAQEEALVRDLGRKFCREKKFTITEMYFEKSLELFPLPGVQRLVQQARRLRRDAEQRKKSSAASCLSEKRILGKSKLIEEFRKSLVKSNAPENQINALEEEERRRHLDLAARTIQRAFHEHYSSHMLRRSIAPACIQSAVRGFLVRRAKHILQQQRYDDESQRSRSGGFEVGTGGCTGTQESAIVPPVGYSSRVDPAALTRLRCRNSKVVADAHFIQPPTIRGQNCIRRVARHFMCSSYYARDLYFVWSRWGDDNTNSKSCQCILSGPYERLGPAQQRYERVFREQHQKQFVVAPPLIGDSPAMPLYFSDNPSGVQDSSGSRVQLSTLPA
ncbi:Transient receptor potential channel pyrexia, partial [Globisporangium splendens]